MLVLGERKRKQALNRAKTYEEWREAALAYDKYAGLDGWRKTDETELFDYVSLRIRLDRLRSLKARHDIRGLLYNLNEGIHGNLGGMGRAELYAHAVSGTKHLIEDYVGEVVHALALIDQDDSGEIEFEEKLDFFRRASHCFGRTALMMSASGSLWFFHLGVARALLKEDLLPSVISGSSGGSIAGSLVCTHTDEELIGVLSPEFFLERFSSEIRSAKGESRDNHLREAIQQVVPDLTFQQAFEKTGRSINISIAPAEKHQTSRLLNAVASPAVLVHSAIRASCAVPGFFSPVKLEALNITGERKMYLPQRSWVDGGLSDDLPAKRLGRLYGINHTVVSQTNPYSFLMALHGQKKKGSLGLIQQGTYRAGRELFNTWAAIVDRVRYMPGGITQLSGTLRSLINQEILGDINIVANHKLFNPFSLLDMPDEKQIRRLFEMGERSTWPQLEMVRIQSCISRRLDAIVARYEEQQFASRHTRYMKAS